MYLICFIIVFFFVTFLLKGQSSDIIRAAVKSGRAVSETSVVSLLAYTGDTTIEGVLQSEELLTVSIFFLINFLSSVRTSKLMN